MLFLPMTGDEALAAELARLTGGAEGRAEIRRFPDGESYVRLLADVAGDEVVLVSRLDRPDAKLLPLLFAASAARRLGAANVRLVAPYLPYMRQDAVFKPGEALTSRDFAALISSAFDALVTVDPHLHRYKALPDLYSTESRVAHAAPLFAAWIAEHAPDAMLFGPDEESEQWVGDIAARAGVGHAVFRKERHGDRDVRMVLPDLGRPDRRRPVLIDDIASSGTTLLRAASVLAERGFGKPTCLVVHALYDEAAAAGLEGAVERILSTDSVRHPTNEFSIAPLLAGALAA